MADSQVNKLQIPELAETAYKMSLSVTGRAERDGAGAGRENL